MSKRMFQILDDMNVLDDQPGSRLVAISPHFVQGQKTKGGGHITMGVDGQGFMDIITEKAMVILLTINKEEYNKRLKESKNDQP